MFISFLCTCSKTRKHLYLLTILCVGTFGMNKLLKEQMRHPFITRLRTEDIWFAKNSSILTVVYLSACPQYTSLILACLHFAVELSYRYQEDVDSTYMHFIYYKSSFNYLPFSRHICLYPANTINYVCFRYQYYKCIYCKTISKTKAMVLFKTHLEL